MEYDSKYLQFQLVSCGDWWAGDRDSNGMEGLPLSYLDIKSLSQWGPDLSGDLSCVHCTALSTHFSQNKMEQHFPSVRTKDLNIYSSFSYQTSWEIMNILANILFDSRNHWGLTRISIFYFPLRPTFAGRWQQLYLLSLLLDILMFTLTFMTSKTCRAHLDVYGWRIEEPGLKLPHSGYKSSIFKTLSLWRCLYLFSLIKVLTVLMNNTKIISTPTRGQWLGHIHGLAPNVKIW